jgi:hypothetical protein
MKIIEKEVLQEVQETMDESEFYSLFKWNSIKAFVTMVVIAFIALVLVPIAINAILAMFGVMEGAPAIPVASIIATTLVFYYAFHVKSVLPAIKWFLISAVYSIIMYIGGEIIFMAILFVGIIITVLFLIGDVGLTGLYIYIDLKKWVGLKKKIKEDYKKDEEIAKTVGDPSQKS